MKDRVSKWSKDKQVFREALLVKKKKKMQKTDIKLPRKMIEVMIAILPIDRAMSLF